MDENKKASLNDEVKPFILEAVADVNASPKYGWGRFRPQCLQFLNSPRWFLVVIIMYTFFQASVMIGLATLTLPDIEKRFSLSGKDIGIIAASGDVTALITVAFISYYGDYSNKIRWIGGGGLIVGLATLMFALPHFLIGKYEPTLSGPTGTFCYSGNLTHSETQCNLESDSRWYYIAIFVLSQFTMGAGMSSYYSLLPAYLDENVEPKSMPVYMGLWTSATFLGPSIGMLIGGKFLSLYVDLEQPLGLNLTARDPRWIGAWWLGYVIFGTLILIFAFFVLGFPREMPGAKELRRKHIKEGNLRKANECKRPSLKKLLPELRCLLANRTFVFNTLGLSIELLFVGGFLPFLPKLLLLKYGLRPESVGYALASMMSPGMIIGIALGSFLVKRFPLKDVCKKAALLAFIMRVMGVVYAMAFIIPGCNNVNMAGVSVPYADGLVGEQNIRMISSAQYSQTASCIKYCRCSLSRYAPVCGSDNITYFDMCHAGCTTVDSSTKILGNCSCILPEYPGSGYGTAKPGYCDRDCKNFFLFAGIFVLAVIFDFMKIVPNKTIILRCVPDNKRAFASGMQYVFYKVLGFLPGPLLFGHVVDFCCRLWQDTCGKKGRCFDYDVDKLSLALCIFGCVVAIISSIFYFLSWYSYKPESGDNEEDGIPLSESTKKVDADQEVNV